MSGARAPFGGLRTALRWLLAAFFVAAGSCHFINPAVYAGMMPPSLPWPAGLIALSGACEVLGGIGILVPATRRAAGWGLVALLVAVFPANLHVARIGNLSGLGISPRVLWVRLPFQAVFIAWVAWVCFARERSPRPAPSPET